LRGQYINLNLGMGYWRMGETHKAQQVISNAITELEGMQDTFGIAAGKIYLALAIESQADFHTAGALFQQAVQAFDQIGAGGNAMDGRAGLARCSLANGSLFVALEHASLVWENLQKQDGPVLEFPLLAYRSCYQVFNAAGRTDTAQRIVTQGRQYLLDCANRISNPDWRRPYLENIPEHRWILEI
jgi:hypothetical protein